MEKAILHTPSLFKVDEQFDDERVMRVRCTAMHTGINRNNSSFAYDVVMNAKDTFANIPVLAHVVEYTDKDGNTHLDYGSHDMHIEDDKLNEGEQRIVYDEAVVGVIPESNNFEMVYDEKKKRYNVMVDAYLYRDYGNYVCDILEQRDGVTDVSMEILCEEVSYDAKEKCLNVGKMIASGITLLGDTVEPGMEGAHAEMFSMTDETRHEQLIRIMQELKESLDNYTATIAEQNSEKGGKTVKDKYDVESEEIIEENLEENTEPTEETTPSEEEKPVEENAEPVEDESATAEEPSAENEEESAAEDEEVPVDDTVTETASEESPVAENIADILKLSVTMGGETKEFSMSLMDKAYALYTLVNETYSDADNTWYDVEAFEDPTYVVMQDWYTGRAYKQSYSQDGETFALVGERIEVYAEWVTAEEQQKLDTMRANYDVIAEKLAKYEAEPDKVAILDSDEYANLEGVESFEALKLQANHFDISVDDLKSQLDSMLLDYAKGHKVEFTQTVRKVGHKTIAPTMPKSDGKGKYGGVFNRKK